MGFTDTVREALLSRVGRGKRYANNKRMADDLGVDPSQLNRFLKRERGLSADTVGKILDTIGVRLSFDDEPNESSKQICFRQPDGQADSIDLDPNDYLAVPLLSKKYLTCTGTVQEQHLLGWILVLRHHKPFAGRSNLIACEMDSDDEAMAPILSPGDTVIIDQSDRHPTSGKIMLTTPPHTKEEEPTIRRVTSNQLDDDLELVFYSENNKSFPPTSYRLERDYHGNLDQAIRGSVIWSGNDMTIK